MLIRIHVITNSKRRGTEEGEPLKVRITARPEKGKANKEVIKVLAEHFKVPASGIRIVSGLKSRNKVIEVLFPPGHKNKPPA